MHPGNRVQCKFMEESDVFKAMIKQSREAKP